MWRIYYADGSTFSATEGGWGDAPSRGVLAVNVLSEDVGREVQMGKDYYLWWPGAAYPWSVDRAGLWDFLHEIGSPLADVRLDNEHYADLAALGVKFGRSVDTPTYRARLVSILNDPDFPEKSAATPFEGLD